MGEVRAFLAIELNKPLKEILSDVQDEFKQIDSDIKYVDPENMHLTLKFFGNITTEGIDLISSKINEVIKDFKPFKIEVEGCGSFPNENHIKVIWVGTDNPQELLDLHEKLDEEFNTIGFEKDSKFNSHLTIGRVKSAKGKQEIKFKLKELNNFSFETIEVNEIILKKSTLTPKGPVYEDLKVFKL